MQTLIETLASLIRVNSINPAYAQGVNESAIQQVIGAFFRRRDIGVREQEVLPDRPNLIATIPGRNPNRRLILEAH